MFNIYVKNKIIILLKGFIILHHSIYVLEGFLIFFSVVLLTGSFWGNFKNFNTLQKSCLILVFICSLLPFITGIMPLILK